MKRKTIHSLQEKRIREYVRKKLRKDDPAHGLEHVDRVVALARKIAEIEGANLRIVVPAAYFHDVFPKGGRKFNYTTEASAEEAEKFLKRLDFTREEIFQIKEAIISASFPAHKKGVLPKTLEAKVVRDADFLDAMGARGIARVFATCAYYGCPRLGKVRWDPENPVKLPIKYRAVDPSPIYHFFSKLLWLKDLMQTKTARKMALKRHNFMVQFLKKFKEESEE